MNEGVNAGVSEWMYRMNGWNKPNTGIFSKCWGAAWGRALSPQPSDFKQQLYFFSVSYPGFSK